MSFSSILSFSSFVVTLCFLALGWRQRRMQRRRWAGGARPANCFLSSYALGNALQVLQQISQPGTQYLLAEQNDEPTDEEDNGDPPTPERLFRRQLRRIRNGEPVGRLRVPLAKARGERR